MSKKINLYVKFEGQSHIRLVLSDAYDYITEAIKSEEMSTFDSITSFLAYNTSVRGI